MTETQKAIEAKIDQEAKDYASNGSNTNYFKNHFPKAWDARYNAYIAGRSKSLEEKEKEIERHLLSFCHWLGKKGYKINGYDDGQLITIIGQFKTENNL